MYMIYPTIHHRPEIKGCLDNNEIDGSNSILHKNLTFGDVNTFEVFFSALPKRPAIVT